MEPMNVPSARTLRREAREMLRGKWGRSFAAMLPMMVAAGLIGRIAYFMVPGLWLSNTRAQNVPIAGSAVALSGLLMFIAWLLLMPSLSVGVYRYMQRLHARREAPIGTVFEPFVDCYGRSLGVYSVVALKSIGVILLCIIGFIILCVVSYLTPHGAVFFASLQNGGFATASWQLVIFYGVFICAFIPAIAFVLKYEMVGNVLAEEPRTKAGECQKISKRLMTGSRWRFVRLNLSYIGWYIPVYAITYVSQFFLPWYVIGVISVLMLSLFNAYLEVGVVAFYEDLRGLEAEGIVQNASEKEAE